MTLPGTPPNPKRITDVERILSVSEKMRRRLIRENCGGKGVGMKTLAQRYGIPEKTVRVIIHDSRQPTLSPRPAHTRPTNDDDLWERPDLWKRYGIKGPCTPRMVPAT